MGVKLFMGKVRYLWSLGWSLGCFILALFIKRLRTPDVDIGKILISSKVSLGKNGYKYFIGYKDDIVYNASKNEWIRKVFMKLNMYFLIKDDNC